MGADYNDYKTLLVNISNSIVEITINRPENLNALNTQVYDELFNVLANMENMENVKAIIITGSGEKAFVAGADVVAMKDMSSQEARHFALQGKKVGQCLKDLEMPVIAAVNGFAFGGGCELAMSCDIIIATENSRFGQPEITLGMIPGNGGTQRLPRLVGLHKAKEMVLLGEPVNAKEALKIGLINKVVPKEELMKEAREWADKLSQKSKAILGLAKHAINNGIEADLNTGLELEVSNFAQCFATGDQKEGIAAFLEKRKPEFKNK